MATFFRKIYSNKQNILNENKKSYYSDVFHVSVFTRLFGFTMGFGYFIADNLIVAFSGAYSYNFTKIELVNYRSGNITSTLAVVPQLGYYFPFEGKLRPSLSIGAGYLWLRERDSKVYGNDNIVYSLAGPSFNAEAGLSYFITQSVSFDLGAQYTYNRLEDKFIKYEVQKQNIVAGAFGVSIFF